MPGVHERVPLLPRGQPSRRHHPNLRLLHHVMGHVRIRMPVLGRERVRTQEAHPPPSPLQRKRLFQFVWLLVVVKKCFKHLTYGTKTFVLLHMC